MLRVVQIWMGESIDKVFDAMEGIKISANSYGHVYKRIVLDRKYSEADHAKMRFDLASRTPDMLYLDADVVSVDFGCIPTSSPAFVFSNGIPDYYAFAVNGDCKMFLEILNRSDTSRPFWPRRYFRRYGYGGVGKISRDAVFHKKALI